MIVGIVGGGQLARMLALAGTPLGLRFVFLDPAEDACAAPLGEHLRGSFDDLALLSQLAEQADVVTYEFENIPEASLRFLASRADVYPAVHALATARDRLSEKSLFQQLEIPTVPFAPIDSLEEMEQAVDAFGLPAILKTRTMGYDGRGQVVLRTRADLRAAWKRLGGVPLVLEGFADFQRELSIIGARGRDGETQFYPLAENVHRDGILHHSRSRPHDPAEKQAQRYAERVMHELDYVGVMALELFEVGVDLVANEMAPRVHNSGHWTIEGAAISQFENHLRAILGLPLGSTDAIGFATMVNFVGTMPEPAQLLTAPALHLHCYDKAPRPGRKIGHATICSPTQDLENLPDLLKAITDVPEHDVAKAENPNDPAEPVQDLALAHT